MPVSSCREVAAKLTRFATTMGGLVLLVSCGTIKQNLPPAPMFPLPQSTEAFATPPYQIQIGDTLDIKLFQIPELNDEVTVRPDGHISTAILKDEVAAGRTVPELADVLQKDYSEYVRTPHLTVVVKNFSPDRIYVGGEVQQPGEFLTVPPNLTLSQALARAGGVKLTGSTGKVIIVRRGPKDVPEIFVGDIDGVRSGSNPMSDVRLANYDVVYVPRTSIAQFYLYFNQYVQQFVPVSWGFSYVLNSSSSVVKN